jgi:hypothetical protein
MTVAPLALDVDAFLREVSELAHRTEAEDSPSRAPAASAEPPVPAKPKRQPRPKAVPAPAPKPENRPTFALTQVEAAPTLAEAIEAAVNKVLTGNHKATVAKRQALIDELNQSLANVPVYGIELDGARVAIGDEIDLDNAVIAVDGYGRATCITVDAGIPIWNPQ